MQQIKHGIAEQPSLHSSTTGSIPLGLLWPHLNQTRKVGCSTLLVNSCFGFVLNCAQDYTCRALFMSSVHMVSRLTSENLCMGLNGWSVRRWLRVGGASLLWIRVSQLKIMLLYPPIVRFDIHNCLLYIYINCWYLFFCLYIDLSVLGNLFRIISKSQFEVHYHFCIREISTRSCPCMSRW